MADEATFHDFPIDPITLDMIEQALHTVLDENNEPIGGEITLGQLLEFLSGYNEELCVPHDDNPRFVHYTGRMLSERDLILTLIAEVRQLRGGE